VAGRNPVKRYSLFDPGDLPAPFGVELPKGAEDLFARALKPRQRKQMTRATMIACATSAEALADAGIDATGIDPARAGVVLGATGTGYAPRDGGTDRHRILRNMASASAAWVSLKSKLTGPSFVVSTACSSGAYALAGAYSLIASGRCDVVISGAADSALNYLDVEGFCSLMALAEGGEDIARACRPFDRDRSGFVMGEGGGVLVLESLEHASARGARVRAVMSEPGLCSEAYNIISPEPEGKSIARAMELALEAADLEPQEISYINAHGTSTSLNDLYETQAIKRVFGDRAREIPVSSTKSMTGHCLSAAAGVEAAICIKAIEEGLIPPTINLTNPDPELDLDYVPGEARAARLDHVMSNSFAFGGQNGVLIFSRAG